MMLEFGLLIPPTPRGSTLEAMLAAKIGVQHIQLSFLDYPTGDGIDIFLEEVLPAFAT